MKFGTTEKILSCAALAACLALAPAANAADGQQPPSRLSALSGTPVNTALGGGGVINKGVLLTMLNFSYRDKDDIVEDRGAGARTMTQLVSLAKIRYGLTDNVEVLFVPGYIHNERDAFGPNPSDTLEGTNDFRLALQWGFLQQKQGAPVSLCLTAGVNLPTGQAGALHPPGGDAWAYNANLGITKMWAQLGHRIDAAIGYAKPWETGNGDVRKDASYTFGASYRYIFNPWFDAGIEFTAEKSEEWERGGVGMNNGYTEMYLGPAAAFHIPDLKLMIGLGVYFPVMRDYDVPTATDDIRIDLKIGKVFSW